MPGEKPFRVRAAAPGEEEAVCRVIVRTWKTAYRGIVDGAFLDAMDEHDEKRFARTRDDIAAGRFFVAAGPDGEPVGAARFGPARDAEYAGWGELYALYVLEERQRAGAGRLLVQAVEERLHEQGYGKMVVECLAENPSRGFYARMGGRGRSDGVCAIGGRDYALTAFEYDLSR